LQTDDPGSLKAQPPMMEWVKSGRLKRPELEKRRYLKRLKGWRR